MSRFSAGFRTSAGSTTLPLGSVYAVAGSGCVLREVHAFNTTAVAVAIKLSRLDTAGTKPAAVVDAEYDQVLPVALCLAHNTHTVGPTIDEEFERATLGAAIGSGVIWTFGGPGLRIPLGVANGIGIVIATGTGQVLDVSFVWEE